MTGIDPERGYRPRPRIADWSEAVAMSAVLWVCNKLPLAVASGIGGTVARAIGPSLSRSKIARRNLALVFPEKSPAEIEALVRAMWEHMGRLATETAHLRRIDCFAPNGPVEVIGAEYIDAVKASGRGAIFFSGHIGQWDLPPVAVGQRGVVSTIVYREINNAALNRVMAYWREPMGPFQNKGRAAAKAMIEGLRNGQKFSMLVDQKMNNGIAVPFFGRPAMTAPALAQFAVRDGVPLLPAHCERLGTTRFRITFHPPLEPVLTGDRQHDVTATLAKVNAMIEGWIRARPEQWLWVHRRWPES